MPPLAKGQAVKEAGLGTHRRRRSASPLPPPPPHLCHLPGRPDRDDGRRRARRRLGGGLHVALARARGGGGVKGSAPGGLRVHMIGGRPHRGEEKKKKGRAHVGNARGSGKRGGSGWRERGGRGGRALSLSLSFLSPFFFARVAPLPSPTPPPPTPLFPRVRLAHPPKQTHPPGSVCACVCERLRRRGTPPASPHLTPRTGATPSPAPCPAPTSRHRCTPATMSISGKDFAVTLVRVWSGIERHGRSSIVGRARGGLPETCACLFSFPSLPPHAGPSPEPPVQTPPDPPRWLIGPVKLRSEGWGGTIEWQAGCGYPSVRPQRPACWASRGGRAPPPPPHPRTIHSHSPSPFLRLGPPPLCIPLPHRSSTASSAWS